MNNRAMEKYKDIGGMNKAVNELLAQAWERGRKFGYATGYEDGLNHHSSGDADKREINVKVLLNGEQIYPRTEPPIPC